MISQRKIGARHKEFEIYSPCIGKSLEGFKQGKYFTNALFRKISLAAL